jgi:AraC-like DNA-binding protein/transcriptional regulator with XRE-family HTH domain
MRRSSTHLPIMQLADLPTASGGLSRLAANRLRKAGITLEPLLSRVGLTIHQIDDPEQRVDARNQIAFLDAAADALGDEFLGFSLAAEFDCRDLGLLYYVMASSDTLGGALKCASRYSRVTNEAIVLQYRETPEPILRLNYSGIPRHADRQQIEFCILAMVRVSGLLTGRQLLPKRVSMMHVRSEGISKFARFLGTDLEFGSDTDEIVFFAGSVEWALVNSDPRLSKILLKVCEVSLNAREADTGPFRVTVENAIAPMLPHGQANATAVAKKLGMSERTLARRLAEEGVTFIEVLRQLKASLADRYLDDDRMPISRIAWLLGYEDASSFSHACRRWTGKSPRELRRLDRDPASA